LLKNQPVPAREFLLSLRGRPPFARRAQRMLADMDSPQGVPRNAVAEHTRTLELREERVEWRVSLEVACWELLAANPKNRMAFEYLMAQYLLDRQVEAFAAHLGPKLRYLEKVGAYPQIPTHYQEAILIHDSLVPDSEEKLAQDPGNYGFDPEVVQRYKSFLGIIQPLLKADKNEEAAAATRAEYGNTYFYYYAFGISGVGKR
jgi:hypothetical protein